MKMNEKNINKYNHFKVQGGDTLICENIMKMGGEKNIKTVQFLTTHTSPHPLKIIIKNQILIYIQLSPDIMADKLDLPHPAKLVPAKQNGIKLETPNNLSYNISRNDKILKKIYFRCLTLKQYQI